ncbi:FAD-dependent oxidoreductase [Nonomuraea sp. CA-141351]|uniref:FAD-dependent oxidoreductase n=1 Tax=Nonomuraea sp. CA-141351 TaxID=3239996 RepID=UPI003D922AA1
MTTNSALPVRDTDVLVVGGGSAGVAAAVAAAEEGARTVLAEASGSVGGTLAWQLLEHSAGFHDVRGEQVTGGFGQRLVERLMEIGASPGHIRDDVGYTASRTPVDHAALALTQSVMLDEAGVRVWLQSPIVDATAGDDARLTAVRVHTLAGSRIVRAAVVIDASGDAAAAALAGASFQTDTSARQPASLLFKLGGVDLALLLRHLREHPDQVRPGSVIGEDDADHVNVWGLGGLLAEGHERGELRLRRTEMHLAGWPRRGEVVVNVTRTRAEDAEEGLGLAHAELGRQVFEFVRWFRNRVPGFGSCHLSAVGDRVGVRESRRVLGLYTMNAADVRTGSPFDDTIGRGAFPIDIHSDDSPGLSHTDPVGSGFEIPYRILVPAGLGNLLVAGRCVSSTHEANGSLRITATCFTTGEAAGVAAAHAAASGKRVEDIDVTALQDSLRSRGARLAPS